MAALQHIKVGEFKPNSSKAIQDRGKEVIKMNQAIFGIVLIVSLGMTLGFPFTCNKLKDVKEGADSYDQYLVKLRESDNYEDAEYVIHLVNQYQAILEQHASNVHEPSVKSQLEISEKAGVLHGTLSQQALLLVRVMKLCKCSSC